MSRAKSKRTCDRQRSQERKINYNLKITFKSFEQKMKERDTARSIVKNLCTRDLTTGEITYQSKLEPQIKSALIAGQYCIEKEVFSNSPHYKQQVEKIWYNIDLAVVDKIMQFMPGEVLNRFSGTYIPNTTLRFNRINNVEFEPLKITVEEKEAK